MSEEERSKMLQSPAKGAAAAADPAGKGGDDDGGAVKMKKELGLLEGVAIILGIIIGSGEQQ